jgi:hypothetical protein
MEFRANWAGGDFGPASARPRGQAAHSARQRGKPFRDGAGTAPWRGPTCQREGRRTTLGGGVNRSGSTAGEVHGGSPPGARFCDGGVAARHGRG